MGARIKVQEAQSTRINVGKDRQGSFFSLNIEPNLSNDITRVNVLNVAPKDRHLLLQVVRVDKFGNTLDSNKFLCGHDERDWFVATVDSSSKTVLEAKEKLKPITVLTAQRTLRGKDKNKRHNSAFRRQGEWYFIPAPTVEVDPKLILYKEPLIRGRGSKPHICEELYRTGGQSVWIKPMSSKILTNAQYHKLSVSERIGYTQQRRNPTAYVRGTVKHSDHATIRLNGWHLVQMNTEKAPNGMAMAFID